MYRNILVPIDLDEVSSWEQALPVATELRRAFGASLALVTIVPDIHLALEAQWSPIHMREMVDTARVALNALADTLDHADEVQRHIETGRVYSGVLAAAEREGTDLILLAAHRPATQDFLLGSNASRIVRHARCSVLVVRG